MNYWLMVVIFSGVFADGTQEAYIFKDPHYHSLNECVTAANDPNKYQLLQRNL